MKRRKDRGGDGNGVMDRERENGDVTWEHIEDAILHPSSATFNWQKALLGYLRNRKDDPSARSEIQHRVNFNVLSQLMVSYNATTSLKDRLTFDSLVLLENSYEINLSILSPLVWGEKSAEIYKTRGQFGVTLNRTTPEEILGSLDGLRMWKTVLSHTRPQREADGEGGSALYDVRFLLRLFLSLMYAGSELKYRAFVEQNGLSLAFSCTSSKNLMVRKLAYCVLQRFLSLMQELDVETADDRYKFLYIYLLRIFKQSIESDAPRLPHLISHFFARVSKLILHPESPAFTAVLSFLSLKPVIDLNNVPELYKLLLSTSTEHYKQEREWILTLISEGLLEPMDYNILQNRSGVKLLLSLFTTCMVDMVTRRLILNALKAAVQMRSAAHDLFSRMNLHSWIASVIDNRLLSNWEQCYLGQIYSILIANERKHQRQLPLDSAEYKNKIALASVRVTAQKVLSVLDSIKNNSSAVENIHSIKATMNAKWRPKKKREVAAKDVEE
ncbi:unnamed protein product [Cylicocyclus nassatus]|uniref:URB1 C-terminal domain-containing protein n=1 Tax=Cylicocyclus nassatus TaxID=53992 RepID=A0AA36GGI1_CYLNA|nr:unnamed protein product [Cylicocyclus nassatus]